MAEPTRAAPASPGLRPDQKRYPRALLALLAMLTSEIELETEQLRLQQQTLDAWQGELLRLLTAYTTASVMLGMSVDNLGAEAEQAVSDAVMAQAGYLANFAADIRAGLAVDGGLAEWDDAWTERARMYPNAIVAPYWKANTRFLQLPAYPGDGSAECLTNDRCMWALDWIDEENKDVDAYWLNLHDTRVCPTCERRGEEWHPLQVRGGLALFDVAREGNR